MCQAQLSISLPSFCVTTKPHFTIRKLRYRVVWGLIQRIQQGLEPTACLPLFTIPGRSLRKELWLATSLLQDPSQWALSKSCGMIEIFRVALEDP